MVLCVFCVCVAYEVSRFAIASSGSLCTELPGSLVLAPKPKQAKAKSKHIARLAKPMLVDADYIAHRLATGRLLALRPKTSVWLVQTLRSGQAG